MKNNSIIIHKGEMLLCPDNHLCAVANKDIYADDMMVREDFEFAGPMPKNGDVPMCHVCGKDYTVMIDGGMQPVNSRRAATVKDAG